MSNKVRFFHNPKCSKCRLTMSILDDKGVDTTVIEYLKNPPNSAVLNEMLDMLSLEPRDLMRTHEKEYAEAGLDNPGLSREQLIDAMIEHPRLIERPIVIKNGKARLGRPPERILDIL